MACICAYDGRTLTGFGRLIWDGAYQCFLCDLIVRPDRQREGIGSEIVRHLQAHAQENGTGCSAPVLTESADSTRGWAFAPGPRTHLHGDLALICARPRLRL